MLFGNYNNLNMLQMSNYQTANPFFCNGSVTGSLFAGTNSIFDLNQIMGGGCDISTNCNGQPNWNAMLGFSLGSIALNIAGMAIGHAVSTRRENPAETVQADLDGLYAQKDAILKKADTTEEEIMKFNIETTDEAQKYNEALAAYNTNEATITAYTSDKTNIDNIIKNYTATTLPGGATKPTVDEYNAAKAKKDAYTDAIANRSKLERAKETALNKKEALERKMKKAKEDLIDINDKIRNAERILDNKLIDRAVGKDRRLISDEDYKALFDSENKLKSDNTYARAHLQKAASKYCKAKTDEQRNAAAEEFKTIYNWLYNNKSDEITSDLQAIYGIICG